MKDWRRVADAVKRRRETLGLNQEDGSASASTYRKLENARQASYKSRSLRAVESDLGWPAGTIDEIAAGGDPPDTEQPDLNLRVLELEETVAELRTTVVNLRDELLGAIEALRQDR